MINRILIRMKVVQLLYSYLLTRNDFHIIKSPERQTRDSRYAFDTYNRMLLLMLELSGYKVNNATASHPLGRLRDNELSLTVARELSSDTDIREIISRLGATVAPYDAVLLDLYRAITDSTIFKDFQRKRTRSLEQEIQMWNVVFDTIISRHEGLMTIARNDEDFSVAGWNQGIKMLQSTLNLYVDNRDSFTQAKNSLADALDKAYELYHLLLLIPVEITRLQEQRLQEAKEKYLPTSDDLNPNTRFIENSYITSIVTSEEMEEYLKKHPSILDSHYVLVKQMLDDVLKSGLYEAYMSAPDTDHTRDCEFWRSVMKSVIIPGDPLAEMLESSSVYWNDDLEIMGTFALKTIKQISATEGPAHLLPMFKDETDARFGAKLFLDAIDNRETYRGYIDRFIDPAQWDADRLAFMDIVVMMVAISELINFPEIPIPVTMNEYIEIANSYSTPRSGQFINGVLFSIINYLKEEGKIIKQ